MMNDSIKTPAVREALKCAEQTAELAKLARTFGRDAALAAIETSDWKRDPFYGYVTGLLTAEELVCDLARQFDVNVNGLRDFRRPSFSDEPPVDNAQPGQARHHSTLHAKTYADFKTWLLGLPDERVDLSWGRDSVLIKWAESVIGRDVDFDHDHATCVETYAYYTVPGDPNGSEDPAYEVFHKDHWIHKLNMWLGQQDDNFDGDANWVPTMAAVKRIALLLE